MQMRRLPSILEGKAINKGDGALGFSQNMAAEFDT